MTEPNIYTGDMLLYAYADFPVQDIPVYDFYISEDGTVRRKEHFRYIIYMNKDKKVIRIHTGNGITEKKPEQMEQCRNGHYYTFSPNRDVAVQSILASCLEKREKAKIEMEKYEQLIHKIQLQP